MWTGGRGWEGGEGNTPSEFANLSTVAGEEEAGLVMGVQKGGIS